MNKAMKTATPGNTLLHFVAIVLCSLPLLLLRSAALYLRFRGSVTKGGRIFEHELVKQGIDVQTAHELTSHYVQATSLRSIVRVFR